MTAKASACPALRWETTSSSGSLPNWARFRPHGSVIVSYNGNLVWDSHRTKLYSAENSIVQPNFQPFVTENYCFVMLVKIRTFGGILCSWYLAAGATGGEWQQ